MILAVGELMYTTIFSVENIPLSTETTFINHKKKIIGNDAPIFSIIASKIGIKVKLFTNKISKTDSDLLVQLLKKNHVNIDCLDYTNKTTPQTICLKEPDGKRTWLVSDNIYFPNLNTICVNKIDYIYFDLYDELFSYFLILNEYAKKIGLKYYLNLGANNIKEKLIFLKQNKITNVKIIQISLNTNKKEAFAFAYKIYKNYISCLIIITLNSNGAITYDGSQNNYFVEKMKGKVYRTAGSGAVYSAFFLYGLLNNFSISYVNQYAVKQATHYCYNKNNIIEL